MERYPFDPAVLDALPEELAELFRGLEDRMLREICSRLMIGDELNEVTVADIKALRSHGIDLKGVKKAIKDVTGITDKKLEELIADVVDRNQQYYTGLIDFAKVTQPEVMVDARDIKAIKAQTKMELHNITQSLGFLVDSGRTMLPPTKAYQWALDSAVLQVESGGISYREAIKSAVKTLAEGGVKVAQYESGHVDQIDVAARRAIMTGVNQLCAKYTEQSAEWLDTPYFEVSAHIGARDKEGASPWSSHKAWQGKVYSVKSNDIYPNIYEVCGLGYVDGLEGANCRHKRSAWVEGVSERTYTDEQLAHIDDGHDCTYDGRHYTAYEATQMQRRIERTMRKQTRLRDAYKAAGLTEDAQAANVKLRRLSSKYKEFSKAANLPEQRERTKVAYVDDASTAAADKLKYLEKLEAPKTAEVVKRTTSPVQRRVDVTARWRETATPNSHVVQDAKEFTKHGVTYKVDGHDVKLEYSTHEKEIAELLEREFGGELYMVPRVNNPQGVATPDYLFRGESYDLKTIGKNAGGNTIFNRIKNAKHQSRRFVIDITNSGLEEKTVFEQIEKLFTREDTKWLEQVIIIYEEDIVHIIERVQEKS